MRCRIKLEPLKSANLIPINYNSAVSQFVYELLEPDTPFTHTVSSTHPNEGVLYYTFSNLYIPGVQLRERYLEFGKNEAELMVSMLIEPEQEAELLERMRSLTHFDFNAYGLGDSGFEETIFRIKEIEVLPEEKKLPSRVKFRMLSPLAAPSDADLRHAHYASFEFGQALRERLISKYTRWKGHPPQDKRFVFRLDESYVQRRRGRISKLVTFNEMSDNERRVKALISPFEVEGNPELIWLGYVAGFGEKNVLGFGCVEPILEDQRLDRSSKQPERSTRKLTVA
jgi:CRISPR-associated endoribonuclease Cas6